MQSGVHLHGEWLSTVCYLATMYTNGAVMDKHCFMKEFLMSGTVFGSRQLKIQWIKCLPIPTADVLPCKPYFELWKCLALHSMLWLFSRISFFPYFNQKPHSNEFNIGRVDSLRLSFTACAHRWWVAWLRKWVASIGGLGDLFTTCSLAVHIVDGILALFLSH